jgi:hypothetical protein
MAATNWILTLSIVVLLLYSVVIVFCPDVGGMRCQYRKVNQATEKQTLSRGHLKNIMTMHRPSNRILILAGRQMMRSIPLRLKLRSKLLMHHVRKGQIAIIPVIARCLLTSPKSAFFHVRCPVGIMNEVLIRDTHTI